ncbi:hypothetical protein J0X20_01325 [Streptomyces sp. KCTC 0041BP]|uniref:hypothetical protein n=1 Tax=Streptomyces sp. KCTC 0041BP TaxID=201500 RepID=UPI001AE9593F|nr:hypothetical protein [Streptomyces sp. KCTC 0041BP]MBP0932294.1 hypothetical protein [Streptomyces sp. KCTC 0041BP]
MRLKTAAAALAASAVLAVPAVAATPAAAAHAGPAACSTYSNYVSYGASCGGTGSYYAWAICQNNKYVSGPVRSGGVWSYAYCSNVGSTLRSGGYTLV